GSATGAIFQGWRGQCDGGAATTVLVSRPTRCEAMFVAPQGTAASEDSSLSSGSFAVWSDPNDAAGGGVHHLWAGDAEVKPFTYSPGWVLATVIEPDGGRWSLAFKAPAGSNIGVGYYPSAADTDLFSTTGAGIHVYGP